MSRPTINTVKSVVPMIYAYTTPEIARHNGWTKIGYTEQDVEKRIRQQTHTADVKWHLEWKGNAIFDDGSGERFTDRDFHAYLKNSGVKQEAGVNNEWFNITGADAENRFNKFRKNRGRLESAAIIPYQLREEQRTAVEQTLAYRKSHKHGEFLWNAKPRFGKTLSVYDFCQQAQAKTVLIVTNRPAIANSWYDDYMKFLGTKSGYLFVSEVDALKNKPNVLSRAKYIDYTTALAADDCEKCIEFVSLQDIKGSKYFSASGIDKLRHIADMDWDILVIDEAHEGVDTYKTDVAFDRIKRNFTLHLSGTPFKALANNKFASDAIYNWTYADEQRAKRDWNAAAEQENPYAVMPRLNLFTYQMSEIVKDELQRGKEINGEAEEYAFDLNEFFSTENGRFKYDSSVDKFLDALTRQEKFPFSTPELREKLRHTFWLLDRVESAKALAAKLKRHAVFKDYAIVLAAGDGRLDDDETKKAYDKVVEAIAKNDKTITLSVGQLTTGVTITEWTAVLMLSNVKSPALYMQAAFRAQNPCLFKFGYSYARKENAYVFDFDPARTLNIFAEFANDLAADTVVGRGDTEKRRGRIKELLNFFPVIGEDDEGELIELDAENVLTIPRKIRSAEVVRRGFMSNYLFQNIAQIFGAPTAVVSIIASFEPAKEGKNSKDLAAAVNTDLELTEDIVIGATQDVFGDKIFAPTSEVVATAVASDSAAKLKENIHKQLTENVLAAAKSAYGKDMKAANERQLKAKINTAADSLIDRSIENYKIDKNRVEQERTEALAARHSSNRSAEDINAEFDSKVAEITGEFKENLQADLAELVETTKQTVVRTVETNKREQEKTKIEDKIRDHLRGFSRTIPSFLMAYGDDEITLENFDRIVPDDVFKEVTSITLEQFRFLRDGGKYKDEKTGEEKEFVGKLFDPVVFNDAVKDFLAKKKKLANYFKEQSTEDIFDYIPPQKTNQIFTPRAVVVQMVDMLEQENPACFSSPDKKFIDLYMKSGMYIAEIVKRLYNSVELKRLYPDEQARLKHIFAKQVYGLAPTEIIFRIATNYILGFTEDVKAIAHNFKRLDALPYAKAGTLQAELDKIYGK